MASDGYLLVQWGKRGGWFAGKDADGCAAWTTAKRNARRFASIAEFRAYERETFPGLGRWLSPIHIRFVRVRPRKEAA